MATKKGPTKGGRILVKLPFGTTKEPKNGKPGKSQLAKVKENVATFLGLEIVTQLPTRQVSIKTAAGEVKTTRIANQGSYRRKSVKLILKKATKIGKSPGTHKTISLPLASGCTVSQAINYFQRNGKSKGIIGLVTPDGRTVQWDTVN